MSEENDQDREWMLDYWTQYIRTHTDKDWSEKQRVFIDMVVPLKSTTKTFKRK